MVKTEIYPKKDLLVTLTTTDLVNRLNEKSVLYLG
jgi:hypothetical protein